MVEVESTYIPHERIPLKFFEGEPGHEKLDMEWNICKQVPPKMPRIQNHLGHT
jgi:hypothetical protein